MDIDRRVRGRGPAGARRAVVAALLGVVVAWMCLFGAGHARAAAADCGTASNLPGGAVAEQSFSELRTAFAAVADGEEKTFYLGGSIDAPSGEGLVIVPGATVTLDLDGCDLTIIEPGAGHTAIAVPATASLVVEDTSSSLLAGQGTLEASGGGGGPLAGGGAGIGGGGGRDVAAGGAAGAVSVSGGTIKASGGAGDPSAGGGAGIGGGGGGDLAGGGAAGPVSVAGGTIKASGGAGGADAGGGAGIGGGGGFADGGAAGPMSVSGGSVDASGGGGGTFAGGGAGIGGGGAEPNQFDGPAGSVTVEPGSGPAPSLIGEVAAELTVQAGARLSVPADETLMLDGGSDRNEGTIEVAGALAGGGDLDNGESIVVSGSGWSVAGYEGPGDAPGGLSITGNAFEVTFSVPTGGAPEEMWVFAPTVAGGGETLPEPTPPAARPFEGWFTAASGGEQVTESSALSAVLGGSGTLHARYGPIPQTISFPAIASRTLGEADLEPGATASSGLPVTYTSQTGSICTILAGKIHLLAAGGCTVTAGQAGDPEYAPAQAVTRSFAVLGEPGEVLVPIQADGPGTNPAAAPGPKIVLLHTPNTPHRPDTAGGPRWTFVFTDTAPGVSYRCRIDGRPWRSCGSPTVYRHLARGPHVFRLRSIDDSGEESPVETVRFRVGGRR